jgi:hypothetical protein
MYQMWALVCGRKQAASRCRCLLLLLLLLLPAAAACSWGVAGWPWGPAVRF